MDRDARWSHQQSLLAKPLSVVRTRWFVRRHLPDHDLDSIVEDVQLVASEPARPHRQRGWVGAPDGTCPADRDSAGQVATPEAPPAGFVTWKGPSGRTWEGATAGACSWGADGMRLSAQVHLHVGVAVWDADRMGGTW